MLASKIGSIARGRTSSKHNSRSFADENFENPLIEYHFGPPPLVVCGADDDGGGAVDAAADDAAAADEAPPPAAVAAAAVAASENQRVPRASCWNARTRIVAILEKPLDGLDPLFLDMTNQPHYEKCWPIPLTTKKR
jgi:hypothetical protein